VSAFPVPPPAVIEYLRDALFAAVGAVLSWLWHKASKK
jgi:hypothetical protein